VLGSQYSLRPCAQVDFDTVPNGLLAGAVRHLGIVGTGVID